ncbi:hypothetical protein F4810DRAFT_697279 [Camillea tinctor]|nr:hypothetical protein F4810DRAFT_697279 [Camillea tinctor]
MRTYCVSLSVVLYLHTLNYMWLQICLGWLYNNTALSLTTYKNQPPLSPSPSSSFPFFLCRRTLRAMGSPTIGT